MKEGKRRKEGTTMQGEEETLGSGVPQQEQVKGKSHQRTYSLGALSEASSLPVSALR